MTTLGSLWERVAACLNSQDSSETIPALLSLIEEEKQRACKEERELLLDDDIPISKIFPPQAMKGKSIGYLRGLVIRRLRKQVAELEKEVYDYKQAANAEANALDEYITEVEKLRAILTRVYASNVELGEVLEVEIKEAISEYLKPKEVRK